MTLAMKFQIVKFEQDRPNYPKHHIKVVMVLSCYDEDAEVIKEAFREYDSQISELQSNHP